MKYQGRRELFKITQWKDGCVYKTKPLYEVWADLDPQAKAPEGHILSSLSTKRSIVLGMSGTMRRVNDDTPSIVKCE
jgi:hypothetical protein